jgi:hypothetical protein
MADIKDNNDVKSISSQISTDTKTIIISHWSEADEELLKEWADHAVCYRWLHEQSHKKYNKIYTKINIPIIIISTITGTASFAQGKIADEVIRDYVAMGIGFFSISAGILATVLSFFKISEKKEQHNNCAKLWDKLHRNIQVEMTKPPSERMPKKNMMDIFKKEYDRLVDDSPLIPDDVINMFENKFKNQENFKDIQKPNILNVFKPIKVNHIEEIIETDNKSNDNDDTNIKFIQNRFKEVNGRLPTDIELQNILENNSYLSNQIP